MTGEVFRARVAPADRAGVRKFLERFARRGVWRSRWRRRPAGGSWSRSCERVGAEVHLAEPAETSGLNGKKKRAKTDWADARHLRELLLVGRLPESWIPPEHILDLRAPGAAASHAARSSAPSGSSGSRRCSITTACPQRRRSADARRSAQWLAAPDAAGRGARAGHDRAGDDRRARHPARAVRPRRCAPMPAGRPGCRALIDSIYGIGELTVGHDPRRARRRPPVLQLPRRRPLRRPGNAGIKLHLL